jgi:hypothetical protein
MTSTISPPAARPMTVDLLAVSSRMRMPFLDEKLT